MEHDDIDELFSEMKKESLVKYVAQNIKPKYIELESSKRALSLPLVAAASRQFLHLNLYMMNNIAHTLYTANHFNLSLMMSFAIGKLVQFGH